MVAAIALVDWLILPYGFLYLFPIMLDAGFLSRWALVAVGIGCAALSEIFSSLDPEGRAIRLFSRRWLFQDVDCFSRNSFATGGLPWQRSGG
jgi:hypothetical protein